MGRQPGITVPAVLLWLFHRIIWRWFKEQFSREQAAQYIYDNARRQTDDSN